VILISSASRDAKQKRRGYVSFLRRPVAADDQVVTVDDYAIENLDKI
jgi:hypothetical protein